MKLLVRRIDLSNRPSTRSFTHRCSRHAAHPLTSPSTRLAKAHCSIRAGAQHWTRQAHTCDQRCARPHVCRPLGASVVRHIHFLLPGAFERAVRWRWVGVNPVSLATPPAAPKPNP